MLCLYSVEIKITSNLTNHGFDLSPHITYTHAYIRPWSGERRRQNFRYLARRAGMLGPTAQCRYYHIILIRPRVPSSPSGVPSVSARRSLSRFHHGATDRGESRPAPCSRPRHTPDRCYEPGTQCRCRYNVSCWQRQARNIKCWSRSVRVEKAPLKAFRLQTARWPVGITPSSPTPAQRGSPSSITAATSSPQCSHRADHHTASWFVHVTKCLVPVGLSRLCDGLRMARNAQLLGPGTSPARFAFGSGSRAAFGWPPLSSSRTVASLLRTNASN